MKHNFEMRAGCLMSRDGGLAVCTVCGGSQGQPTTDCPGYMLSRSMLESICGGRLDFYEGEWRHDEGPH